MKAIFVSKYGAPDTLEVRSIPDLIADHGQIRIRVKAAGLNFADCMARMGIYPGAPPTPFIPGLECAGVVDAVGHGVGPEWLGRRVVAPTWFGGYAEQLLTTPEDVLPIPQGKSFEQGAAVAVTYLTALHGLHYLANLQEGDWVLIHTAAGGVGTAAVQLALLSKAVVIGTASASKHDFLKKMGVQHTIDYRTQDFEVEVARITGGKGVRIAMDPIGGRNFEKSYRSLRRGGVLLMYGLSAAAPTERRNFLTVAWEYLSSPRFSSMRLMNDNKAVIGYHMGRMTGERDLLRRECAEIAALWEQGKIDPVVGQVFPYTHAADAHRYMQDRKNIGKIVLTF